MLVRAGLTDTGVTSRRGDRGIQIDEGERRRMAAPLRNGWSCPTASGRPRYRASVAATQRAATTAPPRQP
ncbi:MAG TPA: hypothetical protein VE913_06255 [Longimicrobium sp.]|nr:hypothetical protein [Longimicrobium sp.]